MPEFFNGFVLRYWWLILLCLVAIGASLWFWKKDVQKIYPIFSISLSTLALIVSIFGTAYINRPYLAIKDALFFHLGRDWISSWFVLENVGKAPALEARPVNFRAILLRYTGEKTLSLQLVSDKTISQDEKEARLAERWRRQNAILEVMYEYFRRNPLANAQAVNTYFSQIVKNPQLLGAWKKDLEDAQGHILFNLVECNPNLDEYFSRGTAIFSGSDASRFEHYNNQMGQGGVKSLIAGENLLVLFWAAEYKTPLPGQGKQRTYFLGSYDALLRPKPGTLPFFQTQNKEMSFLLQQQVAQKDVTPFSIIEHRTWIEGL